MSDADKFIKSRKTDFNVLKNCKKYPGFILILLLLHKSIIVYHRLIIACIKFRQIFKRLVDSAKNITGD
jgi:hypothetical protein